MFLSAFSLSNRAVDVVNWVVVLSFGYFRQSILDILWSLASCVSLLSAELLISPELALTVVFLSAFSLSNRAVYVANWVVILSFGYF